MRYVLSLAMALSLCSFGMVGCKKEESGVKKTEKVTTPGGTETTTTETKKETTGDKSSK